jgi:hypothetical protein
MGLWWSRVRTIAALPREDHLLASFRPFRTIRMDMTNLDDDRGEHSARVYLTKESRSCLK